MYAEVKGAVACYNYLLAVPPHVSCVTRWGGEHAMVCESGGTMLTMWSRTGLLDSAIWWGFSFALHLSMG